MAGEGSGAAASGFPTRMLGLLTDLGVGDRLLARDRDRGFRSCLGNDSNGRRRSPA